MMSISSLIRPLLLTPAPPLVPTPSVVLLQHFHLRSQAVQVSPDVSATAVQRGKH